MDFSFKVISNKNFMVSDWSGGKTTQLAIAPADAIYAKQTFDWRISSATVSVPESTFTALPNYHRILMILEGQLELVHQNHYSKTLMPFDQDSFLGAWHTSSYGIVTDFNLMMNPQFTGRLEALHLEANQLTPIDLKDYAPDSDSEILYHLYAYDFDATVTLDGANINLPKGDLLQVSTRSKAMPRLDILSSNTDGHLIIASVAHVQEF